jgi:alkanesulfonate monooxygenase SsuD/methylene tetrahydromethanopterin reductase-like flavin-dependent oxidoreductase (luciferase family)
MRIGLGLWTMRATAAYPASFPALYAQLADDARLAERLGFDSVWIAEHHAWYDGWCPAPLVAAAATLAATSTLHVGTGIHLLPLYDADRVAAQLAWLQRLSGGRLDYGIGLGYRPAEYDAFGVPHNRRGRRMDAALDRIAQLGADAPPVWVGGFAEPAVRRAGGRGLNLMLPHTLSPRQTATAIEQARAAAAEAGKTIRIGAMRYAWPTDGSDAQRDAAVKLLGDFTREYSGAWFPLRGRPGFEVPDLLEGQMRRSADSALIGTPAELADELGALEQAGVELCVVHLIGDGRHSGQRAAMEAVAAGVLA